MCIEPHDRAPTCFRRSIVPLPKTERDVNKQPFPTTLGASLTLNTCFPSLLAASGGIGESTKRDSGRAGLIRNGESVGIESPKARTGAGERSAKARMKPLISMAQRPSQRVKASPQPPGFRQRFVLSAIERGLVVYSDRPRSQSTGLRSTADSCFRRSERRNGRRWPRARAISSNSTVRCTAMCAASGRSWPFHSSPSRKWRK